LLSFRQTSATPQLPPGFVLESDRIPTPEALNSLLADCQETTHASERWALAFERTAWHLSVLEEQSGVLAGFVRATSDRALNVNLWNLAARPGKHQHTLLSVLVHHALVSLRRDLPGCSFSVSAAPMALKALAKQGFILDPSGIRAMGLRLR